MSDALSVTFNGNVTFQGPMFDIHDNGKVVINNVNDNVNDNKAGGNNGLPKELDTPRARTYFAKAIDQQYMELTEDGRFRWIGTVKKPCRAELAYFLGKVYNYKYTITGNAGENFPEESLNRLFGATRLYSSLTQVYNAQKPQRWRSQIDEMFKL